MQDDMSIIASATNAFGWRTDDFGNTVATASLLAGTSVNVAGIIGQPTDIDMWKFTTGGGTVNLQMAGAQYGGNLDGVIEIRDANGRTLATASPSATLGASITTTVGSGTFYIVARGTGGYGNVGQYTLRGSIPGAAAASVVQPEISVRLNGAELADGSAVSLGSTTIGTPISRTFTVTNVGGGTLTLTPLSTSGWPAGFSLVSNLGDTTLTAGQSTAFTIRYSPTTASSSAGTIAVKSSDANEATFDIKVSASAKTVTSSTAPKPTTTTTSTSTSLVQRNLDNGATGHTRSSGWTTQTGRGVSGDIDQSAKGTGANFSNWSFTSLPNGTYQVYASWTAGATNATNAPFTLYNGSTPVSTVRTNQRFASTGLTADGATWKLLGTVTVTGGRLNVRLSNAADGFVVADAIRIVQTKTQAADVPSDDPAAADLALLGWLSSESRESETDVPVQAAKSQFMSPVNSTRPAAELLEDPSDRAFDFVSFGLAEESDEIDLSDEDVRLADVVAAIL